MVNIRQTDFFGIQLDLIEDSNFNLPTDVENKLNINALKNDGFGYLLSSIPMVTDLSVNTGIKLLNKEKLLFTAKEIPPQRSVLLYIAANGLRILIEEGIINLIENSILDWDKLLVLYGIY